MFVKINLLLLILLTTSSFSQKHKDYTQIISSDKTINAKVKDIDLFLRTDLTLEGKKNILAKFPIWLYFQGELEKALFYEKKNIHFLEEKFPENTKILQEHLFKLGFLYFKNQEFNNSIATYYKVIKFDEPSKYIPKAYSGIARCHHALGDFQKATEYFSLAENIFLKNNDQKNFMFNCINISVMCVEIGTVDSFRKGIEKLLAAEKVNLKNNFSQKDLFIIYRNLGELFNQPSNYDHYKALDYYNKAKLIAQKNGYENLLASINSSFGNLYLKSDFTIAVKYFTYALNQSEEDNELKCRIYHNLGYCHLYKEDKRKIKEYYRYTSNKNKIIKAIAYYKKGLNLLLNSAIDEIDIDQIKKIANSRNKMNLLEYLKDLSMCYHSLYMVDLKKSHLTKAIRYFKQADQVFNLLSIESKEYKSKVYWRKEANDLYSKAIESCYNLDNQEDLFYFIEKNKAIVLQQDFLNFQAKEKLKLPFNLVNKEERLKKEIYALKNEFRENKKESIQIKLLSTKRSLDIIQDSIIQLTPNYLKNNLQLLTTLKDVRQRLKKEEHVIAYSVFEKLGYGLYITKDVVEKFKIEDIEHLNSLSTTYLTQLSKPFQTESEKHLFRKVSKELYQMLFPANIRKYISRSKKLTVIPDNFISGIPFEALINNDGKYLIEKTEVTRQFSNSFLSNITKDEEKDGYAVTVFAPKTFKEEKLTPLNNSINEAEEIKYITDADLFVNERATKKSFLQMLKSSDIIHLATHANSNDSISPWIAFNDGKINLEKLYLTTNNADLVVLSACQTNTGELAVGEGVMSLSRGFFKTGAKSVISSLWNVDDKSTTKIMIDFYKNLKNGQTKSGALRKSKLKYIKNSSLSESSPYYWASFVLIGDTSIVSIPSNDYTYLYIGLGLLVLLIGFVIFYKKQKSL